MFGIYNPKKKKTTKTELKQLQDLEEDKLKKITVDTIMKNFIS